MRRAASSVITRCGHARSWMGTARRPWRSSCTPTRQCTEMRRGGRTSSLIRDVADALQVINDKVSEVLVGMDPQQQTSSSRPGLFRFMSNSDRQGHHEQACLNLCLTRHNLTILMSCFIRQTFGYVLRLGKLDKRSKICIG
jgi:hypothetical protein